MTKQPRHVILGILVVERKKGSLALIEITISVSAFALHRVT